jgi:hypothetical protein
LKRYLVVPALSDSECYVSAFGGKQKRLYPKVLGVLVGVFVLAMGAVYYSGSEEVDIVGVTAVVIAAYYFGKSAHDLTASYGCIYALWVIEGPNYFKVHVSNCEEKVPFSNVESVEYLADGLPGIRVRLQKGLSFGMEFRFFPASTFAPPSIFARSLWKRILLSRVEGCE